MNKTISIPLAVSIILITSIVIGGFIYLEIQKENISFSDIKIIKDETSLNHLKPDIYCDSDSDCAVKTISCESKCTVVDCVNNNWELNCSGFIDEGRICSLPYIAGCKCDNNQCVEEKEDETANDDRVLITEKDVLDLFWYQLNFNTDCNFNIDSATEEILYSNREKGISLKLPYNQNWGNEKYKIPLYFVNEKIIGTTLSSGISFGPIFCMPPKGWERAYSLRFIPQRSLEEAETSVNELFKSPLDNLQISRQEVNGISFIEYSISVAECPPCDAYFIEIIGKKYNYEFNCTSLYEDCFNAIKTTQFIDD